MENPKERIEDILKRNPYLDAKESFFASRGENGWQAIKRLCYFLYRHHKVLPIILVDEYDTPLLEAYTQGYWDEMIAACRQIFHNAFKQNDYYSRAIITGMTRISKNSLFSDLNNLEVDTVTCDAYADCFGFTEQEVMDALKCQNMDGDENSLWSLLLSVGYIKAENVVYKVDTIECDVSVTNKEVMAMYPLEKNQDAFLMEFKVWDKKKEKNLEETVERAFRQMEEKKYVTDLVTAGINEERIYKLGFAFAGKEVLVKEKKRYEV